MSAAAPAPLPRPEPDPLRAHGVTGPPSDLRQRALHVAGPAGTTSATSPTLDPGSHAVAGRPAPPPARRSGDAGSRPALVDPAPFPDDTRLRLWLVPRSEPPAAPLPATTPAHERPPVLGSPRALARPRGPAPDRGAGAAGAAPPAGPLPDPTRLCCAVVQAAVEGLRGVRPLAQLTRWVTPEVYDRLALRARLVQEAATSSSSARAGIRRVRVCRLGEDAAEATVVVDDGPRVRAVALRVEEHRGRWRATALEIG